jgi:xylulokinase
MALLVGYDVGSSSIKATIMEADTGRVLTSATSPEKELQIIAKELGWAEQHPHVWWEHVKLATRKARAQARCDISSLEGIGVAYQMHGLVLVDKNKEVLRPSIIWCDSRAVPVGEKAASEIGEEKCLERLLNLPGNFTASKLKWVMENEPEVYSKIHKIMLPGDYIAMKMTGEIKTTPSGLSEGIMWDFQKHGLADLLLDYYGIKSEMTAEVVPTFSVQGELTKEAADELGLKAGVRIEGRHEDII